MIKKRSASNPWFDAGGMAALLSPVPYFLLGLVGPHVGHHAPLSRQVMHTLPCPSFSATVTASPSSTPTASISHTPTLAATPTTSLTSSGMRHVYFVFPFGHPIPMGPMFGLYPGYNWEVRFAPEEEEKAGLGEEGTGAALPPPPDFLSSSRPTGSPPLPIFMPAN